MRVWLTEQKRKKHELFVPLQHYAGPVAQVDYFEVTVDLAGVRGKAWMLVVRLMRSGRDSHRYTGKVTGGVAGWSRAGVRLLRR